LGKPGPKCTVCTSPHRAQIDIGLVNGLSCKSLAERFCLGTDAVERHSNNHLLPQQRAAILSAQNPTGIDLDALKVSEAEGLLSHVLTQRSRLDNTGAGVPVLDMMDDAGLRPVRIDIGSGKEAQKTSHNKWSVPKTLLIQNIDARLSTKELRISDKLAEAPALIEELENYQAKISSATGYTSFNAREGKHDDLVLALGIALFSAVNRIGVNEVTSCSISGRCRPLITRPPRGRPGRTEIRTARPNWDVGSGQEWRPYT
jgi:hypothetical protein